MALFTDGPVSAIEDLAAQDSQVLNVASVEGIDLTRKLAAAQEAVAIDLEAVLRRPGVGPGLCGPYRLTHVAVTPALRLWHTYRTLEMVYGDAYYNQLNDRYANKRDHFSGLGKWAYERLILTGLGIVPRPVPRAQVPDVEPAAGAVPDGTYYVTMAWLNAGGEEGASAIPAAITTTASGFTVQPKPANDGPFPDGQGCVTGWNVYAGAAPDAMVRQNAQPIAVGATWTQTAAVVTVGSAPGRGQAPSWFHAVPRIIQRG
ncbi:MAG TPA: hypothetical protein VKX45_18635 [Bryobacteraceae bacterium]|jgi:hypothetical protein|nr:hypothetical protein [Bryobacteraceae bacterium]